MRGINRNIMECKDAFAPESHAHASGINRNIMECKVPYMHWWTFFGYFVLIETLWNVKNGEQNPARGDGSVLIETLWNVKG